MASSLNFPDKTFMVNSVTPVLFIKVASLQIISEMELLMEVR